jgi:hypothetical protein
MRLDGVRLSSLLQGTVTACALIVVSLASVASGQAAAAAVPAAGGGSADAASPTACTDSWVGTTSRPLWTIGANWSTGKLPRSTDDVCITTTGDDVITTVSIHVHSLFLGADQGVALEGSSATPLTATVDTSVTLTPGAISRIDLTDASIVAQQIEDRGGSIDSDGRCALRSPDIVITDGGALEAADGTTTLSSLAQLAGGTLTGARIGTSNATVVIPGDVTSLVGANVTVGVSSALHDAVGDDALANLDSVDAKSSFTDFSALALGGALTTAGTTTLQGPTSSLSGPLTETGGTLTIGTVLSAAQVTVDSGTLLQADGGTIQGNLTNKGTVATGGTHVAGDYQQASGAELNITFGAPLHVAGAATLAGEVASGEPIPTAGVRTPLITFGTVSGGFTTHALGIAVAFEAQEIDARITPQIAASPASLPPGGTVTISGASFPLGNLSLTLDGAPFASTIAGYFGRFSVAVVLPQLAPGVHTIAAGGQGPSHATTRITITGAG